MSSGIRATVEIADPGNCPIAAFSAETGASIDRVSTSVTPPGETPSATEFLVSVDRAPDDDRLEPLFAYGEADLYRVVHDDGVRCPCVCLGEFGCPMRQYTAENGAVTFTFHATDFQQLQAIIGEFRDRYPTVDVQKLLQPPLEDVPLTSVFVNRGRLTARQLEVLQTAYEMGYFERPKGANATEIAAELGISQSTATEHLIAAQRKILDDVLVDRSRDRDAG